MAVLSGPPADSSAWKLLGYRAFRTAVACLALTLVMMMGLQQNRFAVTPDGERVVLMDAQPGDFHATTIAATVTADLDDCLDDAGWTGLPSLALAPPAATIGSAIVAIAESSDATRLERPPRTTA
ncbi:hypothetical protein [Methylobacterium sp. BTF04]|uniref:hypothetical protein n=1 Tax=Methylobacterium sp. BTF04 TaxID=2708300 RepID=UPI001953C8DF|nr:hypothetical protein [Methylobacterium sp. BTF04]